MSIITNSIKPYIVKDKDKCFEIYGVDIILSSNLHPYLLEINKNPDMKPLSVDESILNRHMISDVLGFIGLTNELSDNFVPLKYCKKSIIAY